MGGVDVHQGIELARKRRLEVVTLAFGLRPVDDADGAL
jgi:hypothetical protein